ARTAPSTLSLHDALPISFAGRVASACGRPHAYCPPSRDAAFGVQSPTTQTEVSMLLALAVILLIIAVAGGVAIHPKAASRDGGRSEEHASELQSLAYLVC